MSLTESELHNIAEKITSFGMTYTHEMTEGEMQWLDFVRGRYAIADYIIDRMDDDLVVLDNELSKALDDDCRGAGKAVCLSDDTDLQSIFFYCYSETEEQS